MKVMILLGFLELSNEYEKYLGLGSGIFSMILHYVLCQFHKDILFIIEYWVFDKRYLGSVRSSDDGVGGIQAEYILPLHYDVTDQWYCISLTRDTLLRNATLPMHYESIPIEKLH